MARRVDHALHDILEAIGRVEEITQRKSFAEFELSWQMRWLVHRAIEIISEASRAIPDDLANMRPEIPWRKVRGIGNILSMIMKAYPIGLSGMSCSTSFHV